MSLSRLTQSGVQFFFPSGTSITKTFGQSIRGIYERTSKGSSRPCKFVVINPPTEFDSIVEMKNWNMWLELCSRAVTLVPKPQVEVRFKNKLHTLTFKQLREANIARLPLFKNNNGRTAHSKSDGSDWTPAQWLQAVLGELGEYANVRKKYERGDITYNEFYTAASSEIADVQCYLDILAYQLGIDLGEATAKKWDEVSQRIGVELTIQ